MTKGECNKIGHKKRPAENYLRLSLALKAKNGKQVNLLTLETIQLNPRAFSSFSATLLIDFYEKKPA